MSREVPFYMLLYVFLLLCATTIPNMKCAETSPADLCSRTVELDIDEIEVHLAKLDFTDVPTVKMMTAGFKCPVSALPFGALKSDWSRLLLLREAQPDGSILKRKLVRLMRILIVGYYQMEERFGTIGSDTQDPTQSPVKKATIIAPVIGVANESAFGSSTDHPRTTKVSNDGRQRPHSFSSPKVLVSKDDCPKVNTTGNCTTVEIAAAKISSSSRGLNGTTGVLPIDRTRQNVTSSIEFATVSTRYFSGSRRRIPASNVAIRVLGDCLKQSLNNIASRRNPNGTYDIVFERLKNKRRGGKRATQRRRN